MSEALKIAIKSLELIANVNAMDYEYQKEARDALDSIQELEAHRTWVGLTDKEIEAIWKIAMFADYGIGAELSNQPFVHYARAIEAKLKEKNNG